MTELRALPSDLALDDVTRLRQQLLDWLLPPPSPALIAQASLALVFMALTVVFSALGLCARRRHVPLRLWSCQNGSIRPISGTALPCLLSLHAFVCFVPRLAELVLSIRQEYPPRLKLVLFLTPIPLIWAAIVQVWSISLPVQSRPAFELPASPIDERARGDSATPILASLRAVRGAFRPRRLDHLGACLAGLAFVVSTAGVVVGAVMVGCRAERMADRLDAWISTIGADSQPTRLTLLVGLNSLGGDYDRLCDAIRTMRAILVAIGCCFLLATVPAAWRAERVMAETVMTLRDTGRCDRASQATALGGLRAKRSRWVPPSNMSLDKALGTVPALSVNVAEAREEYEVVLAQQRLFRLSASMSIVLGLVAIATQSFQIPAVRSAAVTEGLDATVIAGLSCITMLGFALVARHSTAIVDSSNPANRPQSYLSAAESPRSPRFPLGPFLHSPTAPADEATIQLRRAMADYRFDAPKSPCAPEKSEALPDVPAVSSLLPAGFRRRSLPL